MSNLGWAIYRGATLKLMEERDLQNICVGELVLELLPKADRDARLKSSAEAEGHPDYFG